MCTFAIKYFQEREFPGSPVVRIWCFHCLESLIGESRSPSHMSQPRKNNEIKNAIFIIMIVLLTLNYKFELYWTSRHSLFAIVFINVHIILYINSTFMQIRNSTPHFEWVKPHSRASSLVSGQCFAYELPLLSLTKYLYPGW